MMSGNSRSPGPLFIVSTGRCGSTMLSDMVRLHPRLLSVSEFFAALAAGDVRDRQVSGEGAFRRLNTTRPAARAFLSSGLEVDEYTYPLGPNSRYTADNVPPIMGTTLPHLTEDHEELWDELSPHLRARGHDSLLRHYRFVFEWLARHFGKQLWLERSGGSLLLVRTLARRFPDARFVHVFRDGRDTAMSMRGHHAFRAMVLAALGTSKLRLDPFSAFNWPPTSPWVPPVARLQFRFFSAERYLNTRIGLPAFGWFWSNMIERGTGYLEALQPDRVLSLRFESMLESPREEISRFIEFVGPEFADPEWLKKASDLPRAKPPSWTRLAPDEHAALAEACAPGQAILGYSDGMPASLDPGPGGDGR